MLKSWLVGIVETKIDSLNTVTSEGFKLTNNETEIHMNAKLKYVLLPLVIEFEKP